MNRDEIKTGFQKLKPIVNIGIVIGSIFAFLFVGRYLLNFVADFAGACRNVTTAFKGK